MNCAGSPLLSHHQGDHRGLVRRQLEVVIRPRTPSSRPKRQDVPVSRHLTTESVDRSLWSLTFQPQWRSTPRFPGKRGQRTFSKRKNEDPGRLQCTHRDPCTSSPSRYHQHGPPVEAHLRPAFAKSFTRIVPQEPSTVRNRDRHHLRALEDLTLQRKVPVNTHRKHKRLPVLPHL